MPTVPTPETALRIRYAAVVASRVLAFASIAVFLSYALMIVLRTRVFGTDAALYAAGFLPKEPVLRPMGLTAVYPACLLVAALIVPLLLRWLVPQPKPGCPYCDHAALPETGTRCPECGRELPGQCLR